MKTLTIHHAAKACKESDQVYRGATGFLIDDGLTESEQEDQIAWAHAVAISKVLETHGIAQSLLVFESVARLT